MAAVRARKDPQRRRRRPPRDGKDVARRGAALPGGRRSTGSGRSRPGTTVSDWDEDEQKRQMSISMSLAHTEWQDRKINLIDVPGDPASRATRSRCAAASSRARSSRCQRRDGRRGRHGAGLEARGRARPRARRLREHARPRARRLLPHARGAPQPALDEVRRRAHPDRRRARADGDRRRPAHVRVHEPRGREGGRARPDPGRDGRPRRASTARSCSTPSSRPTRR